MALGTQADSYTLGRGEIYFAPFAEGTETPMGERYLGNTPEFNLTINEEKLEHYNSDRGVREKDRSISLQVDRTGSLVTDNISADNVAMFFFGTKATVTVTAATVTDEVIAAVEKDRYYQLGTSTANPAGHRALDIHTAPSTNIIVKDNSAVTTYAEGTDYKVDMALGRIYIMPTGTIVAGAPIKVTYKVKASSRSRVLSGSTALKGALRFVAANPEGKLLDYFFPSVTLAPNGDFALKSDEWLQIPLTIEVLKAAGKEAIIVEERAVTA